MPNVAIIFAGGTGTCMNTRPKPKQFLELHGKPILTVLEKGTAGQAYNVCNDG